MVATGRDNANEKDDAARFRPGDRLAFQALVLHAAPRLHRIAHRMLGDAAEAEDVAQESLLKLWNLPRGAAIRGTDAWLTRVTVNLCLDRVRRRRFQAGEAIPDRADDAPAADQHIEAQQAAHRVRACINRLNAEQRAAIVLTYYEDLSNQDAAQTLDMKIKAFESLLFRARAKLRDALAAEGLCPAGERMP